MNDLGALDALAEQYGIEPEFTDAVGATKRTSAQTQRALLAALGVEATDDAASQAALDVKRAEHWQRVLPPVLVAPPDALRVPVVVSREAGDLRWTLTLEHGEVRSATVGLAELTIVEREPDGGARTRRELVLPSDVATGYHRLRIDAGDEMLLIVTPGACWLPPALAAGERLAGIATQLYLLRSADNWGIGDFSDLQRFVTLVAERGGDVVGLNPLHSMFLDEPEHASPYSPASRLLLNVLNIDVTLITEYAQSADVQAHVQAPDFARRLADCRAAELVDYSAVAALKIEALQLIYAQFRAAASAERRQTFADFRRNCGRAFERTFVFMALRRHFADIGARASWQDWPAEFRDPASAAVEQFAREHAADVDFEAWLQWIADTQLGAAAQAAEPMRVGLYRDLAVGADPAGAETWANQAAVVTAARVGAPPDIYNPAGQDWGLPPFHPQALRDEGYRSFIELVRANMRHAGGLRIDHVMALRHLYWVPDGATPGEGAYVRYPLDDLVGILALESQRSCCLVVGEDLGTVPAGFRERMAAANILSYRVLFFEREATDDAAFLAPAAYPALALAVLGSHDLPTLAEWWDGADIRLRERLGLLRRSPAREQTRGREHDRDTLLAALRAANVLDASVPIDRRRLFAAAHAFLAATASALAVAQIDDVTGEMEPVNVPTTSDERPNWRRKLSRTLEELARDEAFAAVFREFDTAGRLRKA